MRTGEGGNESPKEVWTAEVEDKGDEGPREM